MHTKFGIIAIILVLFGAVLGGVFGRMPSTSAGTAVTVEKILADYKEALSVIEASYVGNVDHEKVTDSSVQGMLWTLDPH